MRNLTDNGKEITPDWESITRLERKKIDQRGRSKKVMTLQKIL